MKETRGVRNNNPGNIRKGSDQWKGMLPEREQTDAAFVRFSDMAWGIRAMFRILKSYERRLGTLTVDAVARNWAPPSDGNNTRAYALFIAEKTGMAMSQRFRTSDTSTMKKLVKAMCQIESRYSPSDELLEVAAKL